jgi:hypothetical protein
MSQCVFLGYYWGIFKKWRLRRTAVPRRAGCALLKVAPVEFEREKEHSNSTFLFTLILMSGFHPSR